MAVSLRIKRYTLFIHKSEVDSFRKEKQLPSDVLIRSPKISGEL